MRTSHRFCLSCLGAAVYRCSGIVYLVLQYPVLVGNGMLGHFFGGPLRPHWPLAGRSMHAMWRVLEPHICTGVESTSSYWRQLPGTTVVMMRTVDEAWSQCLAFSTMISHQKSSITLASVSNITPPSKEIKRQATVFR